MVSQVSEQLEDLLNDPSLLYQIQKRLTGQGYIGENENKLRIYLIATTRSAKKEDKISALITGESGVGKTKLMDIVTRYFSDSPDTPLSERTLLDFHRITAHAPDYLSQHIKTLNDKILIVALRALQIPW